MKHFLFIILLISSTALFAQPANVTNAKLHLKSGDLGKAKEAIDKAAAHETTKSKFKTLKYKGDIYYALATSTDEAFQNLSYNAFRISFEAYKRAKDLAPDDTYIKEINQHLRLMQNFALNKGVSDFNKKEYDLAFDQFVISVDIAEHFGVTDSLAYYNCALAAEKSGHIDEAIGWYKRCVYIDYHASECCGFIVYLLRLNSRDEEAFEQIQECRSLYPYDQDILIAELNLLIAFGQAEEAEKNLRKAIENDPNNPVLYFALGALIDAKGGDNQEAETLYLQALQLKEDYFDANYNLGAYYFNKGVEVNNLAVDEEDDAKYQTLSDESDALFEKAIPYLEKARESKPYDVNTLNSLMTLYARLENTEKYMEIKEILGK